MFTQFSLQSHNDFYKYIDWKGVKVPKQLAETFEIYHGQGKSNCLAISSMLMYHNYLKIPVIRQWTYEELGIAHFLKQIYNFGNVYSNTTNVVMSSLPNLLVNKNIYSYDNKMGFIYPDAKYCADEYSYDARRILNNLISDNGFPFRIATHIKGFYLSADSVSPEFGIDKNKINLSLRKKSWHADSAIEVPLLFKNISEHISIGNLIKKWQEELNLIEESFLADHSNISSTISSTEDSRNIRYENAYQLSRKIGKLSREKNSIMSESEIKEINRLFAMAKRFARENVLFFAREQGLHVVNDSYYRTANVNGEMFYFFALHRLPYYDDYYQITLSNTPDKSEQEIHGHYFTEELTISLGDGLYFNKYELSGDQLQKETKVSIPKYFAGKFAPLTPHSIGSEDFAITPNVTVKFFEAIMDRWSLEEGPEIDKYNFNYFLEKSHITYEGEDYKILKHIKPGYAEISIIELNPNYSFKKKIIEEGGLYVVSGSGISQYKDQKKDIKANDIVYLISNKKDEINILNTSNYPMVLFSLETIIDFN